MDRKITLPELVSMVAESTNTTKRMSELFLRELLATVSQSLIEGDNVTIKNLGTFKVVKSADKQASTNRRSKPIGNIIFVPDKKLAEAVNQPFEAFVPVELSDEITDEQLAQIDKELEANELTEEISGVAPEEKTDIHEPLIEKEHDDEPQQEISQEISEQPADNDMPAVAINQETPAVSPLVGDVPQQTENRELVSVPEVNANETVEAPKPSNKSFLWGLLTGVAAALVVALICWGLWGRPTTSNSHAVQADTIADNTKDSTIVKEMNVNQVTDTCTKWLQLQSMAKKHYGKHVFWVYIYEENKAIIDNPSRVEPGTVLVIPPAEKYGIDKNSRESINTARQKREELDSIFRTR